MSKKRMAAGEGTLRDSNRSLIGRLLVLPVVILAGGLNSAAGEPAPDALDSYNVVWETPSENYGGSLPLGNGDLGLNVWVEADGDVQFFISKTDAWDDNARLVKVGKVRVHLEPNPVAAGQPFRQTLRLRDGTVVIEAGQGERRAVVRVWADANLPVIHVTADSPTPLEATAAIELWRTEQQPYAQLQTSDIMVNRRLPDGQQAPTILEPDMVLADQAGRIGWYHHNVKSVGPQLLGEIQGLTEFGQPDPLLRRTFGAIITAERGQRVDDLHLQSPAATSQRFNVYVLTQHPASPAEWLAEMDRTIARIEALDSDTRRAAHDQWWSAFWDRSWIRASLRPGAETTADSVAPANLHPVRLGLDQGGGNRWAGEFGRVSLFGRALSDQEVQALARGDRQAAVSDQAGWLFSGSQPGPVADSAGWDLTHGLTIEAWVQPEKLPGGGARIVDKITPGGSDGFLLDTCPGNSLRFICGQTQLSLPDAVPAGRWTHVAAVAEPGGGCRLYVDGRAVGGDAAAAIRDEAAYVSQMYHLQRFVTACAGRGRYPIKFNGSIFTVPLPDGKSDPDYRRWGPGYWWQNTRLPYYAMTAAGDYDLLQPLFRMYADDLLDLCKYRTQKYCGHAGAFYPECIMFWGAIFSETYGWTPWEQRQDKLQESGWHKWEWVGGLELCWLMLDYYEHTQDQAFLEHTVLPFAREILTFFDQHYATDAQGKLVMHPSQALETWWECTNPMPEVAGCLAVTERLLALPSSAAAAGDRESWQRLRDKLPPLPRREVEGQLALAPAEKFARKSNIENPELYAVFPFRLVALGRPDVDQGVAALNHRWDRGHSGWRQDDLFMAYLGLTDDVRKAIVSRARRHDRDSRFPAFWGPNYDWTPDQCHGGVLCATLQSMLLQTDGKQILVLPAWPRDWDVDFKLHAPQQTVLEGRVRDGRLEDLKVTPAGRRADVVLPES